MRVLVQYLGKGISLQEGHLQGRGGGGVQGGGGERGATVWSHGENKLIFQKVAIILGSPLGDTPAS